MPALGAPRHSSSQQASRTPAREVIAKAQSSLARGRPEDAIQILSTYLQSHSEDSAARLVLGQACLMAGQNDRAETEFHAVLRTSPNNYAALISLGEMYDRAGQPEKTEPLLMRAVKLGHGTPQVRMRWALALARLHRYKEANSALAGVPEPNTREERVAFHRLKGSVALGLGKPRIAAAEMERALALKPDDTGLQVATAAAELQAKNWERVVKLAEPIYAHTHDAGTGLISLEAQLAQGRQTEINQTLNSLRATALPAKEDAAFHQRLAEVLTAYGRFSESVEDFSKAAELEPKRADLVFNLALAQFKAGRFDDALASAEKCRGLGDTADLEDLLGDIQEARGDYLAAVRSYQAATALAPGEERYRLSLVVELIGHENFDAAKLVLKQAEESLPSSWRIQLALGMVEFLAGSDEEASRTLLRAADLAPEPVVALRYLGDMQMDLPSAPDPAALNRLCQYSDRHPHDGKAQFHCGALLFRREYVSGNKSHTAEILRRLHTAAGLLPGDASPHCQLGKVFRWMERWLEARAETEICVRMDPGSGEAHYRLGQIYQRMGQEELAREQMKLYSTTEQRQANENARRIETMKTFLYTIRKSQQDRR